ncbi:dienelactone hydrolase [Geopyxis carbonaria]|nr:dienelactone hydrolase [Geopyxis carbonaria]
MNNQEESNTSTSSKVSSDILPSYEATQAMGDHCTSNPPLDPSECSSGEIVKLAGTDVYISKPADSESQGTSLLILLTNGVGVNSVNNQVQADHFAKAGYFVAMPDLFKGDNAPNTVTVNATAEENSILDQVKLKAVEGVKGFMIAIDKLKSVQDMWLARHTPENTMPIIEDVMKAIKERYGDKSYTVSLGTYAVGYCFGGKYALRLAASDEITAAAIAHGVLITKEEIESITKPTTFACVENDPFFPDDIREEGRRFLEKNKAEFDMRVYKNVPHGFGVYGSYPEQNIKSAQKESFKQFIEFLSRH